MKTHSCGELRKSHVNSEVKLYGWVENIREHGKVAFIDLRDRSGKVQVVLLSNSSAFAKLKELTRESCVSISGKVSARKPGTENKELATGEVEVVATEMEILGACKELPFEIGDEKVAEEVRLKKRFLDLRSERLQSNILLRHKVIKAIINYLDSRGFIHIETPILAKSTPEGARDYLVPSRVHAGKFYALPQSPQIFKQLCMVAGFEKYFQIARCFRDEDLRADRQPEFTQLDIEMSFVEPEDVIKEMEGLFAYIWKEVLGVELKTPFPRLTYADAIEKYGRDNPDLRKSKDEWAFVWIVDFPMFEWDDSEKRWYAMHHPFTSPEDNPDWSAPSKIKAKAYDLVLNGSEIGGGSIRIHKQELQEKVFETLGISPTEAKEKFGFLLDALSYGAPPHGGIAFGLDRIIQLMTNSQSLRDVIAFPKNREARDVMMDSPSEVSEEQLREAHIKLDIKENERAKQNN
ncbi:aspartate--tRNA ligase [Candidatus Pacearchaeota archaeon]|nr:MAG: aspartate--tRNA ligase [Candidatus Pacearchaeota archaeon]